MSTPSTARFDMYRGIHKALRAFMADTLTAVGRMDAADPADVARTLGQVRELLMICAKHVHHENEFMHPAIEARSRGASLRIAGEHEHHEEAFVHLESAVRAVEAATGAGRAAAAHALYLELSLFVADNFQHMHYEETVHNATLWECYSDAELQAIEAALLAQIPPAVTMQVMRWMVPYDDHAQRVELLSGIRAHAPAPVFEAVLALARSHLAAADYAKLERALGLELPKAA